MSELFEVCTNLRKNGHGLPYDDRNAIAAIQPYLKTDLIKNTCSIFIIVDIRSFGRVLYFKYVFKSRLYGAVLNIST